MYGISSISQIKKRVDIFDKSDWLQAYDSKTVGKLIGARHPIQMGLTGSPISPIATWLFDTKLMAIRAICGDPRMQFDEGGRRERMRAQIELFAALAPFLLKNAERKPPLELTCGMIVSDWERPESAHGHLVKSLRELSDRCSLRWVTIDEFAVAMLLEKSDILVREDKPENFHEYTGEVLIHIAGLIHDYHAFRLPFWRSAPSVVIGNSDFSTLQLRNMFADPLSFTPAEKYDDDTFLWPWQKCLISSEGPEPVQYQPIPTTSLALDLRASTSAMEMTDLPDKFAEFIDEIVGIARRSILQFGGYFDKDTGDGVVGHFCALDHTPKGHAQEGQSAEEAAVRAGQEIIHRVLDRSIAYQRWLRHGIENLGPAIGIHSGTAVWLADEVHIRAIGSSVVGAARLCSVASMGEIVISNQTYYKGNFNGESVSGLQFVKKPVLLKEYGDRLGTFAYAARAIS